MRTPGFTASATLSQTPRGSVDGTRAALLDTAPAVVPAQDDLDRVSHFLSSLGGLPRWWLWEGGPWHLWEEPPACPPGQKAVWVDRAEEYYPCYDDRTGLPTLCRIPPFRGWECQSAFRVVA